MAENTYKVHFFPDGEKRRAPKTVKAESYAFKGGLGVQFKTGDSVIYEVAQDTVHSIETTLAEPE